MTLHTLIAGWMAIALITPAAAAEIYRCGPNGSTYSQTPCAEGRRIEINDARSDEQRAEARRVTERNLALASSLENDRRADEAAHRPALAGSFNAQVKKVSNPVARPHASANAKKKRLRLSAQAANRSASKPEQAAVLAQPRH